MKWKQPIDTGIYEEFGDDTAAMNLFIHLLLRSQNEDMTQPLIYKGKPYQLQRGQTIFGRNEYAKLINLSPSGTRRALQRLEKVYSKVTSKSDENFTIVNILNYNAIIQMDKQSNKRVPSKKQRSNTPKNGRSIISKEIILEVQNASFSEKLTEKVLDYIEDMQTRGGKYTKTPKAVRECCVTIQGALENGFTEKDLLSNLSAAIRNGWRDIYPKRSEGQVSTPESQKPAPQLHEITTFAERYYKKYKHWNNNAKNILDRWLHEFAKRERVLPDHQVVEEYIAEYLPTL